jgi:predicted Zn-dependent protease
LEELGTVVRVLMRHDMVFLKDVALERNLDRILQRLTESRKNPQHTYRVWVINDTIPNSFSGPNGTIYITTGLLNLAHSESELAFFLAHELAHSEASDQLERFASIKRKKTATIAGAAALGALLMVVTVGAAAAAMGPMATATTSSTMITNVGATATTMVVSGAISSGSGDYAKVRFGRVGGHSECVNHPVYASALFGYLVAGLYEGYGSEREKEANKAAVRYLRTAGYPTDGLRNLVSRVRDEISIDKATHLSIYLQDLEKSSWDIATY